jgi:CheY-like chemotaxis protein
MEQTLGPSPDMPVPWSYSDETKGLAKPGILVVEDDRQIRDMLSTLLDMAGYSVRACATAEEALDALREQIFDLILTDYALPNRTGLWLIENAAAEGLTADTPVLIVTAHPGMAQSATYEVISKPFDVDDLIERVRRRTESSRPRRRQLAGPPRSGGDSDDGTQSPEPVELVLYVNARSPKSAAAVRTLRKAVKRINSPRARITICEMDGDPCDGAPSGERKTLDRSTNGPRTFILGHITNPEPLLELLMDCDTWE